MSKVKVDEIQQLENEIKRLKEEAKQKQLALRKLQTWEYRMNEAAKVFTSKREDIVNAVDGYDTATILEKLFNPSFAEFNLKLQYHSATFDDDVYRLSMRDIDDMSEYPVFAVFAVKDLEDKLEGYIQLNCLYSSYNGNEYNNWKFVKPVETKITVFQPYKP